MAAKLTLFLATVIFLSTLNISVVGSATVPTEQMMDRISKLPGQPKVSFSQFSGYVTVNDTQGRALFYWLTEAVDSPEKKPLVLWLSGGPGCSSIAYGAVEEVGPFRINKKGSSLYMNKYSWNKEANLLFLESPAGVGFSYTNTTSNLKDSGDKRTAEDALVFLLRWMSRFPQYKYRDFYIAGESYSGHYIPQLAKKVVDNNKDQSQPFINLKGFIVGNAVTDVHYDGIGTVMYWWSHCLISDATYKGILKSCDFSVQKLSQDCDNRIKYAMNYEFGAIDQYSIYTPTCLHKPNQSLHTAPVQFRNTLFRRRASGYDPCTENYAEIYYNLPEVQQALHANRTRLPYKWTACSDDIFYNWKDSDFSMIPVYKELIAAGLRIWIFSGDTDSIVPVTATRLTLSHMNLSIKTRWYPWYNNKQVGGWTEVYDELTFAVVRGAGHEVPLIQPKRAYILFKYFLAGKQLPRS